MLSNVLGNCHVPVTCMCCSYEGTGRSLSLKLMRELEKSCTASSTTVSGSLSDTKKLSKSGGQKPQPTSLSSSKHVTVAAAVV